jgi:hypothetical protein
MINEFLRHTIASIAYRFLKSVKSSREGFGDFKISTVTRSPREILYHMYDLAAKTKVFVEAGNFDPPSPLTVSLDFSSDIERFLRELHSLDIVLGLKELDIEFSKRLLQGPLLDITTHVGQIALLNGLHGNKIEKEDYSSAAIITGKIL